MKNETRERQRQLAAVHLSGHAVAWLLAGQRMDTGLDFVALMPGSGWRYLLHDEAGQSRDLAVALLAGYAAELALDPDAPERNGAADMRQALKTMREFAPAENIEQLGRESRDLVRRFRDVILTFAGELLRRETITGPQCEELFHQLLGSVTH
jgi:hypothetical protein